MQRRLRLNRWAALPQYKPLSMKPILRLLIAAPLLVWCLGFAPVALAQPVSTPTPTESPTQTVTPAATVMVAPTPTSTGQPPAVRMATLTLEPWAVGVVLAVLALLALITIVLPAWLQMTDRNIFNVPYITWFFLHYDLAIFLTIAIIFIALFGLITAEGVTALLGSLLGYVLGGTRRPDSASDGQRADTSLRLSPQAGLPGQPVTISGRNFGTQRGQVLFGQTAATINSWTDGSIQVTVPRGIAAGKTEVTVRPVGSLTSFHSGVDTFEVQAAPAAASTAIQPGVKEAAKGTQITITGKGFGDTPGEVLFDSTPAASVTTWGDTSVAVIVPDMPTGPVVLTVRTADGTSFHTAAGAFTVTS